MSGEMVLLTRASWALAGVLNAQQKLNLTGNRDLEGHIPPEIGNLANVEELYLGGNNLSGSIPAELGNLSNIIWLGLSHNELTGSIPPELGDLEKLERLHLRNNDICGSVPVGLYKVNDVALQDNPRLGSPCEEAVSENSQ